MRDAFLLLLIEEKRACGFYIKNKKIIASFPYHPPENLQQVLYPWKHIPLIVGWHLESAYKLKKPVSLETLQLLRTSVANPYLLYIIDQSPIALWLKILKNLPNPLKAMMFLERKRNDPTVNIPFPLYALSLTGKVFSYWGQRGIRYGGGLFLGMALIHLAMSLYQKDALPLTKKDSIAHLFELEKTYQTLSHKRKWSPDFCQKIEKLHQTFKDFSKQDASPHA